MSKLLEVKDVMKIYGRKGSIVKALDGITFEAEEGEFTGVMGASGSGKTTLLNCIATIDKVTAGRILVGGQDITRLKGSALSRFRRDSKRKGNDSPDTGMCRCQHFFSCHNNLGLR